MELNSNTASQLVQLLQKLIKAPDLAYVTAFEFQVGALQNVFRNVTGQPASIDTRALMQVRVDLVLRKQCYLDTPRTLTAAHMPCMVCCSTLGTACCCRMLQPRA